MKLSNDAALVGVALLAAGGLVWWATRPGVAGKAAAAAVGVVGDAAVGTVKGIGGIFGIPDTNLTTCQKNINAGEWWEASFNCPAGTFLGGAYNAATGSAGVYGSTVLNAADALDARREYAARDPRRLDLPEADPLVTSGGMDFRYF